MNTSISSHKTNRFAPSGLLCIFWLTCLALGLLSFPSPSHASLMGFWPLSEGHGPYAFDYSGNGNTGTFVNATNTITLLPNFFWTNNSQFPPLFNSISNTWYNTNCIDFLGVNNTYVDVGNPASLVITGAMTVCCWAFPYQPANGRNSRIIDRQGGGGSRGWSFEFEGGTVNNGIAEYQAFQGGNGPSDIVYTSIPCTANQWIHLTAVFMPSNAVTATPGYMSFYTNGILDNTHVTALVSNYYNGNHLYIGERVATGLPMYGMLQDIRLYDEALSGAAIAALPELQPTPLAFTTQPVSVGLFPYATNVFSTSFTGSPPYYIQWYTNNVLDPSAIGLTYTVAGVTPAYNGYTYRVSVSNLQYSITSTNATLTVFPDTNKPVVAKLQALGNSNAVVVVYNKPIDPTTSQNTANYQLTNSLGAVINIYGATLGADNETLTLATDPLAESQTYHLEVSGILDQATPPNMIVPTNVVFTFSTLVGFWRFEDGPGHTTTADSGPGGFTGTLINNPAWINSPFGNWCLNYNGGGAQYVDVGNPTALQLTGPMTVSAWVLPAVGSANGWRMVSKQGGGGSRGWSLSDESGGNLSWAIASGANSMVAVPLVPLPYGTWTHVVGVYDPNNPTIASLLLYTNGLLAGTLADGTVPPSQYNPALNVTIGARPGGANPWYGAIDNVRIYARALSAAEITALPELAASALSFARQPVSTNVTAQGTATFTASVNGAPPYFIQWYTNNVAVPGAAGLSFSLSPVQDTQNGLLVKVIVTNTVIRITSTNAVLTVPADHIKPTVANAVAFGLNSNQVIVTFSKVVNPTDAQTVANYVITNLAGGTIAVYSAVLQPDGLTVYLSIDGLTEGAQYALIVSNIRDLASAQNMILANSSTLFQFTSLVGYWKFEEGTGTTAHDSGPGGFTGTLMGNPAWASSPFGNSCLNFNGLGRVDMGNPAALQLTGPMTLAAWLAPTAGAWAAGGRTLNKQGDGGSRGFSLNVEDDRSFAFQLAVSSTYLVGLRVYPGTADGEWIHVTGVYDPNDPGMPILKMYTNGVYAGSLQDGSVPPTQYDSGLDFAIGSRPNGNNNFSGLIDEARVYCRALSDYEVAVLGAPKFLSAQFVNNQVILNWIGNGQLQAAPAVTGVYTNVLPTPTSPFTNSAPRAADLFYRLSVTPVTSP